MQRRSSWRAKHPDLIEATIESLDREGGGHLDVRRTIENGLPERRRDEAVAAVLTQAEERGLQVLEYEGYQPNSYRALRDGLGLDRDGRRQHRREPCHAVTVEARGTVAPIWVEVCKSHPTPVATKPTANRRRRAGRGPDVGTTS